MTTQPTPVTFGPRDLDGFISALRRASSVVPALPGSELASAAEILNSSLESWEDAIEHWGAETPAPSVPATPTTASAGQLIDDVKLIDALLSRIILRHSNFGFAAANCPSDLDRYFPGGEALLQIRLGRRHLRAALSSIGTRSLVGAR